MGSFEYTWPDGETSGSIAGCSVSWQWPNGRCESRPSRAVLLP